MLFLALPSKTKPRLASFAADYATSFGASPCPVISSSRHRKLHYEEARKAAPRRGKRGAGGGARDGGGAVRCTAYSKNPSVRLSRGVRWLGGVGDETLADCGRDHRCSLESSGAGHPDRGGSKGENSVRYRGVDDLPARPLSDHVPGGGSTPRLLRAAAHRLGTMHRGDARHWVGGRCGRGVGVVVVEEGEATSTLVTVQLLDIPRVSADHATIPPDAQSTRF